MSAEHSDAGFTLTELLVVIVLFAIIGAIVVAATTAGLHGQTKVQDRNDALSQMRTAMQRVERDIRSSNGIGIAQDDELVLRETQASVTRTMTYSVVTDGSSYDLVVDETDDPSAGTVPRKTLLTHLVNPADAPVFSYGPVAGYTPTADSGVSAVDCSVADTSPTAHDPSCIGVVTVHFEVQPPSLGQPIDLTDNGTELRNPG